MRTRTFGPTGLVVSEIGLGLAALGRPGYITIGHHKDLKGNYAVAAVEAHAHGVLDAAWQVGVRYYDAARSYGRAEEFLGSWLRARDIPRSDVVVGSKWGCRYTADWEVDASTHEEEDHTPANLRQQWIETRSHLGDYLCLYQIHSVASDCGVLADLAVLEELAHLKGQGIHIGLSVTGPKQADVLRQGLATTLDGTRLFDAVQATWNLLERSCGPVLQEARDAGMGVIVKEALANGRLTPRNDAANFSRRLALLKDEAARRDTTVDALALAAALAQPWADVVLSGAATEEQVRSNATALMVPWDTEAANRLLCLAEPPDAYWETRARLPWN